MVEVQRKKIGRALATVGAMVCAGVGGQAYAAPVAVWDFEASLGGSTVASGVTASDLELVDITATTRNRAFGIAPDRGVAADGSTYVDGEPIDDVSMSSVSVGSSAFGRTWGGSTPIRAFAFSVAIAEGYELNLTDVTFDLGLTRGSIANLEVMASPTSDFSDSILVGGGYGWAAAEQADLGYGTGGTLGVLRPAASSGVSWNRYTNDAGLAAAGPFTDAVYFRIVGWGSDWNNDDSRTNLYLDNLTINGAVIPEPASLAMLGLAGLVVVTRGRRRS